MQLSRRLKKLVSIVEDVQVELREIMREMDDLSQIRDDDLEGLLVDWVKELEEADAHLEEAADIMWGVAEDMEREGL
ncbi:MAG: hypothetical protein JHC26_00110 [Thermofilum sp.]|uniref:hypothetical protein n=1 Tax=Thermofilum sp. TaxID=1961369 RepID=UPI0025885B1B|nr:hypothetical protein [Thermofilum sp.]MCI4407469.1 hypothetical protein [Thermofilum sp.]